MSEKNTGLALVAARHPGYARVDSAFGYASVETDGEDSGRHCTYGLNLSFTEDSDPDEAPAPITFRGEVERDLAIRMLRWMADELESQARENAGLRYLNTKDRLDIAEAKVGEAQKKLSRAKKKRSKAERLHEDATARFEALRPA